MPANLGPHGIRHRRSWGLQALAVALGGAAALFALDLAPAWRALLFLPLYLAGLGIFQARAKT